MHPAQSFYVQLPADQKNIQPSLIEHMASMPQSDRLVTSFLEPVLNWATLSTIGLCRNKSGKPIDKLMYSDDPMGVINRGIYSFGWQEKRVPFRDVDTGQIDEPPAALLILAWLAGLTLSGDYDPAAHSKLSFFARFEKNTPWVLIGTTTEGGRGVGRNRPTIKPFITTPGSGVLGHLPTVRRVA